jgi:hypothetical protein
MPFLYSNYYHFWIDGHPFHWQNHFFKCSSIVPLFKIGFQAWDELRETNMEADMFVSFLLGKLLLFYFL